MTTDFLVTFCKNGKTKQVAYSVKDKYEDLFGDVSDAHVKRLVEIQTIEMNYWKLKGVDFRVIFGDKDINKMFARNIALIVGHYNMIHVQTPDEFMCYLLANKYISVPMEEAPINISELTHQYLGNTSQLYFWISEVSKKIPLSAEQQSDFEVMMLTNVEGKWRQ